jgi:hypothetical protein
MLARRIVLAAALAAALALLAFLVVRDDGAIERRGGVVSERVGSTPSEVADMSAAAGAEVRSDLAAPRSASGRTSADAPSAATSIGKTFGELLHPRIGSSRPPLDDFTVVCTNAAGEQRRARARDVVFAEDLAPDGLWIVAMDGYCPRVVDPAQIAQRLAQDGFEPFEFWPRPSVTLTVVVEAAGAARAPIDRLVVTSDSEASGAIAWLAKSHRGSNASAGVPWAERGRAGWLWDVAGVTDDVLALVRGVDAASDGVLRVGRIRRSPFITAHADGDFSQFADERLHDAAWSTRVVYQPGGSTRVFENMPAHASLVVCALGAAPLDFVRGDGAPIASHIESGVVRTASFSLLTDAANELSVLHESGATVRGRLPQDVLPGARLNLSCEQSSRRSTRTERVTSWAGHPVVAPDGSFEWSPLDAGDYSFLAEWERPGNVSSRLALKFALAPGEVRDLGELRPGGAGRLTIHTHLVVGTALPRGFGAATHSVRAAIVGPLDTDLDPSMVSEDAPERYAELLLDGPIVVEGLAPGAYGIRLRNFRLREFGFMLYETLPDRTRIDDVARLSSPDLVRVLNYGTVAVVDVGPDTVVDVEVVAGYTAASTIAIPLGADFVARDHTFEVQYIRRDGRGESSSGESEFEFVTAADGSQHAVATCLLTPGEWVAIVSDFEYDDDRSLFDVRIARHDITLTSAVHTTTVAALAPSAMVRLRVEPRANVAALLADFGDRQPMSTRWQHEGEKYLLHGLLPHTRYRIGERVVETGAPGSVVELD